MVEENMSQEFRLKNIEETKIYFIKEIEENELKTKKHKKVCTTLNYKEHFLIFPSTITGFASIKGKSNIVNNEEINLVYILFICWKLYAAAVIKVQFMK